MYVHTYIPSCRITTVLLVCTGDDSQHTNLWPSVLDSQKLSLVVSPLGWQDDGSGEDKGETFVAMVTCGRVLQLRVYVLKTAWDNEELTAFHYSTSPVLGQPQ